MLQRVLHVMRQEKGLTQVNLAQRLGRPQSYVSKYESGERKLDLPELRKYAACWGSASRHWCVGTGRKSVDL